MNCPTALASSLDVAQAIVGAVDRHRSTSRANKPVITNWLGEEASRGARELFAASDIASFATPAAAIDGFMDLVRHARAQDELMRTPPSLPEDLDLDTAAASATIAAAIAAGRRRLSEVEAMQLLGAYGIAAVPTEVASDADAVGELAARLIAAHGACVVKILSDDIVHKSDIGGVRLGLERPAEAKQAALDMLARARRLLPAARIQGFTLQPMVRRKDAHELILGMSVDPTFGPLLLFGAGGTAVEVMHDTAHALPPLDLNLAQDLMRQTRVWRLLQGYRGRRPAAIGKIAEALVRLGYIACRHPEVRELDINPLLADEDGVIALDARVAVAREPPRVALAIRPYPSQWRMETHIEGLGALRIRPIRPEDEALYTEFTAHVTPEDRRLRFFTAAPDLSHRFLARLTQIDYAREMAFVAIAADGGALLGVARLVADPDYVAGEYAILVRSDLKGRGLGWTLMQHLIAYARAEGLAQLYGYVLAGNTMMLQMCRSLGFAVRPEPDGGEVRRVVLQLASPRPNGA
jgi:acetyltransferase